MQSARPRSWSVGGPARFVKLHLRRFGLHPGASWGLSWVLLFAGGMIQLAEPTTPARWLVASLLVGLFPAFTLLGALGFAGWRAPLWVLPAGAAIGLARGVLLVGIGPAPANLLGLLTEPVAELAAAAIVWTAPLLRAAPLLRFAVSAVLVAVATLDAADALSSLDGAPHALVWPLWYVLAPTAALLQLWAMWFWIAQREVRIERAENVRRELEEELARRRRTEALLRENEAWLFDFYEKAPEMLLALSPGDLEIRRCNRKFSETLGYARRELVGRALFDFLEPSVLEEARRALASLDEKGQLRDVELRLRRRNGSQLDVLASLAVRPGPSRGEPQVRVILHDVTAARRGSAGASREEGVHRLLTDHAPVGLFYVDAAGHGLLANARFYELSGLAPEREGRIDWLERLQPGGGERLLRAWREAESHGAPWRERWRLRDASGSEHLVQAECVAVRDGADGQIMGFAGSLALLDESGTDVAAPRAAGS
jgi:PAS domain S-box-containing protein